jgi:hypothetical protein
MNLFGLFGKKEENKPNELTKIEQLKPKEDT